MSSFLDSNNYVEKVSGVNPQILSSIDGNVLDYKIYGNSVQKMRSGKNLFDINTIYSDSRFTITDNEVSGMPSSFNAVKRYFKADEIGTTFTISALLKCPTNTTYIYIISNINGINYASKTTLNKNIYEKITFENITPVSTNDYIKFSYGNSSVPSEIMSIKEFQLEKGSTATEYEPYGIMPSPEYPSEIQSVGDLVTEGEHKGKYRVETKVFGKNLFNKQSVKMGYELTIDGAENRNVEWYISDYILVKKMSELYLTSLKKTRGLTNAFYDADKNYISSVTAISGLITVPNNAVYMRFNGIIPELNENVQIEQGTTATEYKPFVEPTTITAYLDEPLRKIGDYADYIDFENQKVVRKIKEKLFDGTENFIKSTSSTNEKTELVLRISDVYAGIDLNTLNNNYCNILKCITSNGGYISKPINSFIIHSEATTSYNFRFNVSADTFSDEAVFKNWLTEKYLNGIPMKLCYVLKEALEEDIELVPMSLKNGINNIISTTSIQPSNISIVNKKKINNIHTLENSNNLNNKLNTLKKNTGFKGFNAKSISSENNVITINDAMKKECDNYKIYGNSVQKMRSGKNLFDNRFESYTKPYDYYICPINLEYHKNYYMSIKLKGTPITECVIGIAKFGDKYADFKGYMLPALKIDGTCTNFTFYINDEYDNPKLIVYCKDESQFNSIFENYDIQLELGSTATEYEQYGVMPSPDYPSEIESVGDKSKNLIPYPYAFTTRTTNGITFTDNSDGTITADGTATADANFVLMLMSNHKFPNGAYMLSGTPSGGGFSTYYMGMSTNLGTDIGKGGIINITSESVQNNIFITIKSGVTVNNLVFKPQLEEGSVVTPYIPFNKYKIETKVCEKNIIDFEDALKYWRINYTLDVSTNEYVFSNLRDAYAKPYKLPNGTSEYTLSGLVKCIGITNPRFGFAYIADDGSITRYAAKSLPTVESTTMKNVNAIYLDYTRLDGGHWRIKNVQVELGSTSTDYEPYNENSIVTYLDEPLRKIGNYADYIDFESQKVARNVLTAKLLSSMNIYTYDYLGQRGVRFGDVLPCNANRLPAIGNREINFNQTQTAKTQMWLGVNNTSIYWVGILDYLGLSTIDEFKTWLNNNPTYIYYKAPDGYSYENDIELAPMPLKDGINNIIITTAIQPSNVKIDYKTRLQDDWAVKSINNKNGVIQENNCKGGYSSSDGDFNLNVTGKNKQNNLIGKNILVKKSSDDSKTLNGVDWIVNKDGSITIEGTPTNYSGISWIKFPIKPNQAYYLSGIASTINTLSWEIHIYDDNNVQLEDTIGSIKDVTFTTPDNASIISVYLKRRNDGLNISKVTIYPQLEEGSVPTLYEQYCGLIPSPNINFPQDIKYLEENSNIEVCGENLINDKIVQSGYYYDSSGDTSDSHEKYCRLSTVKCLPNTLYTLSSNMPFYTIWCFNNNNAIRKINTGKITTITFTTPENCNRLRISIAGNINDFEWCKLEYGDTATPYEPYIGKNLSIPCDLYDGDNWNPITGEVNRYSDVIIANTSNVNYIENSNGCAYINLKNIPYRLSGYCTHTKFNPVVTDTNDEIGFTIYNTNNEYRLLFRFDINMTSDNLNTILLNNEIKFVLNKVTSVKEYYTPQKFIFPKGELNILSSNDYSYISSKIVTINNK